MIAFYYALSGIACIVYYRRELTKSIWNFVFIGVGPAVGASDARVPLRRGDAVARRHRRVLTPGQEILGLAPPIAIGYGFLLLGVILMVVWR